MDNYRICRNKYNWYKIQKQYSKLKIKNWKYNILEIIILCLCLPLLIFIIPWYLCNFDNILFDPIKYIENITKHKIYYWEDHTQFRYNSKEEAEYALDRIIKREQIRIEKTDNSYVCQEEIV